MTMRGRAIRCGGWVRVCAAAALAAMGSWQGALAAEKPLIEKWLDGEVKANYPAVTYDGPPIELRWATFLGEFPIDVRGFERLTADTNGKLVVRPYWGNTLTDMTRGAFESVSSGIADFGPCIVSYNPAGLALQPGLQVPFKFETSVQGTWAAMELYPAFLKKDYEQKNVYLFRMNMTQPAQVLTSGASVDKLEDLGGKKIWSLGSPIVNDMIKALGAVPTFIPIPETYTAFQSGIVDGIVNHDASYALFKWNELGKHHLKADLWPHSFEYCLNKERFDGIPSDLKRVFYHWAQLLNQANAELYYDASSETSRQAMKAMKVEMKTLSDNERERWAAKIQPVLDKFASDHAGEDVQAFFTRIGDLAEKYRKMTNDEITKNLLDKPIPGVIDF